MVYIRVDELFVGMAFLRCIDYHAFGNGLGKVLGSDVGLLVGQEFDFDVWHNALALHRLRLYGILNTLASYDWILAQGG
jgi:hypothetical protein